MPIELFNPVAEPRKQDIDPVPGLESLAGKTVALLSNTHPGVDPFMDRLEQLFEQRTSGVTILRRRKDSISRPMSPELQAEIVRNAQAVITGVGT